MQVPGSMQRKIKNYYNKMHTSWNTYSPPGHGNYEWPHYHTMRAWRLVLQLHVYLQDLETDHIFDSSDPDHVLSRIINELSFLANYQRPLYHYATVVNVIGDRVKLPQYSV